MRNYHTRQTPSLALLLGIIAIAGAIATIALPRPSLGAVTQEVTAPPPPGMQVATLSAGCFWSMQAIFQQLRGVVKVDPGYSGGTLPHPSYEEVETGTTGYAETANITFDPKVITYATLLKVLLTARDPTTLNSQGPDVGTQYRSVIFYRNSQQKQDALNMIKQINEDHIWPNPIVTQVQPFHSFYRAESYHLNYYALHPDQPYCRYVIAPEIAHFRAEYAGLLKA